MIYTLTANPSIDYVLQLTKLTTGAVNRSISDVKLPGGKGVNVTRILNQLDLDSTALGFVGGATGDMFKSLLNADDVKSNFTKVNGDTRINVKVKASDEETEINGAGPKISDAEKQDLLAKAKEIKSGDVIVMSGSLPQQVESDFYLQIAKIVTKNDAEFVIDTTGQALLDTLDLKPLVIKPNNFELAQLFNKKNYDNNDAIIADAQKLQKQGAKYVMVSMAGDGALLVTKDHAYQANPAKGTVKNSVGAGDSMIAGFVGTFMKTNDPIESFKVGAACGSATAFSEDLATADKIKEIKQQIHITTLK